MFTKEVVKKCVDMARSVDMQASSVDPKFYESGFLANVFGVYTTPFYPNLDSIRSIEDLWRSFYPRLATDKQKAELIVGWVHLLDSSFNITTDSVLAQFKVIMNRQAADSSAGQSKGIRYQFLDPFVIIAKDIDSELSKKKSGNFSADTLIFKNNQSAFEYATKFCSTSLFDGAVIPALVRGIKNLGSVFVLQINVCLDGVVYDELITIDSHNDIVPDTLIAVLCSVESGIKILLPIAVLEPTYNLTNGWIIKRKIGTDSF
jgi:hypothetical protein